MSSSDSDSDDSLLLAACAFSSNKRKATRTTTTTMTTTTRSNNRQNAKDTKRSNLLDEMFFQQEERISRRRRMDETIKKEQQEGFIPHEDDLIISLADHPGNDPIDAMGGAGGGGGGAEKEVSCQEKESNSESQDNSGIKGNAGADDNDDDDDDDTSASENKDDKMNRTANSRRVNQPHVIVPPPVVPVINYDFDDPAYRARIEAIKEKSRKMTLQPHESRRQMQRQIEGLDVLDDDDDDDEEEEAYGRDRGHAKSSPRNTNHPARASRKYQTEEDIERRMAEIAGAHCTLGMRRTLGWKWIEDHDVKDSKDVNHGMYFIPFESRSDALTELVALFQKYDCEPSKSLKSSTTTTANSQYPQDGMKLWMSVRNQVIQPLKKSHGMQILPHMLRRDWKSHLNVPLDIIVWLMRVATTGNNTMFVDLGHGACEMIRKLLERDVNIVQLLDKDGTVNMVVASSKMFLDMDQFVPILQLKYGLWMAAKFEMDHDKNPSDCCSTVTSVGDENNHKRLEEPSGLRHAMMIWTKAIQGGYVQIPQEREKAKICITRAISAVLFCGMDPIFHNGHGLLQIQGDLLVVLIQTMYKLIAQDKECTIYQNNEQIKEFEQWALYSAKCIINSCQDYSSLPEVSDEENTIDVENKGWLIIQMMLRSWSIVNDKDVSVILFYSKLCHVALEKCLGWESNLWDDQVTKLAMQLSEDVHNSKDENSKCSSSSSSSSKDNDYKHHNETIISTRSDLIPHRYHVLANAESAFQEISKPSKSFISDTPRLLAIIYIASVCEQVAMELFNHNIQRQKVSPIYRGFCENDAEASMLYHHLDRMCTCLQIVKKSIRIVLGKPFLRRSKELALLLLCTIDKQRDSVAKWDKRRKSGVRRQSDLSNFFQTKDENKDYINEDDGDGSGSDDHGEEEEEES